MTTRGPYRSRKRITRPKTLGERILWWRQAYKMSQRDLAEAVRVPQQSVSAWEREEKVPSGPSLENLIRVMGISEAALLTGKGFEIPVHPWPGLGDSSEQRGVGDLVVKVEDSQKTLILPSAEAGKAWGVMVDEGGKRDPLTREQALAWVEHAFENNQPLWIVVKSEKKQRAKLPKKPRKA